MTVSDLMIHRALSFFPGFDAALVVAAKLAIRSGVASFGGMSIGLPVIEELKMKLLSGERESAFVKSLWLHEAPFRPALFCIYPCVDLGEVQIDWLRMSRYASLSAPACESRSVQRKWSGECGREGGPFELLADSDLDCSFQTLFDSDICAPSRPSASEPPHCSLEKLVRRPGRMALSRSSNPSDKVELLWTADATLFGAKLQQSIPWQQDCPPCEARRLQGGPGSFVQELRSAGIQSASFVFAHLRVRPRLRKDF